MEFHPRFEPCKPKPVLPFIHLELHLGLVIQTICSLLHRDDILSSNINTSLIIIARSLTTILDLLIRASPSEEKTLAVARLKAVPRPTAPAPKLIPPPARVVRFLLKRPFPLTAELDRLTVARKQLRRFTPC